MSSKAITKVQASIVIVIIVIAAIAGASYYVLVPPTPPKPKAPSKILIGVDLPMTGGQAELGKEAKEVLDIWLPDVNKDGGIYLSKYDQKVPVELMILDDQSNTAISAPNIEKLANEGAAVIFGPSATPFALSGAPAAERSKIPIVPIKVSTVKLTRLGYTYVFAGYRSFADDFPSLFSVIETIPAEKRPKTFAIISDNTAFGTESLEWFVKVAKERGYADKIVLKENITAKQVDFTASILKIKKANPDLLFDSIFFHSDVFNFFRQMKANDFFPKMYVGWTAHSTMSWVETLGKEDSNYAFIIHCSWHEKLPFPGAKELAEKYRAKYNKVPHTDIGLTYAVLQVIEDAIKRAGEPDREKIKTALYATDLNTVLGKVKFRQPGETDTGRIITPKYVAQYQKGELVLVWPKEYATGALIYPALSWGERK